MGEDAEPRGTTTLDGFRVLWVAIKREPIVFTVATLGAVLFGVLTVADAWVRGWATQHVLLPAFETGEIGTDMLVWVVALFMGVAILRAVGIVARRLGGGIMYYRMQSHTRRGVTRQYLSLPMEWHQRHPTGQLLSNANSDVEAAWGPIAPLPMAVGTVAMMLIAVIQMFVADVVREWAGLGYNRRAVNLHRAAVAIGDSFPDTLEGLLALPGVGPYTARAILAFAFERPVAYGYDASARATARIGNVPAAPRENR